VIAGSVSSGILGRTELFEGVQVPVDAAHGLLFVGIGEVDAEGLLAAIERFFADPQRLFLTRDRRGGQAGRYSVTNDQKINLPIS
jgi:hypothetical protein